MYVYTVYTHRYFYILTVISWKGHLRNIFWFWWSSWVTEITEESPTPSSQCSMWALRSAYLLRT